MPARTPVRMGRDERPEAKQRQFEPQTSSIASARRFVNECVAPFVVDAQRLGDIELATSELVTNAVEHGDHDRVLVGVETTPTAVMVSVTSARSSGSMADPSSWAGPLPAMRSGRGLAIVRAVSSAVRVDADDATLTVTCTFNRDGVDP